ncbi:Hypothetical predicted protein [Olea europaea subsp. europaea]|uniref:Uncharacterized protein n=1 Tax=Olea europaea subsp. europaea TaxID=158383 RepID=A0A8S0V3Z7_OLEEU|nr:Hypothetical predicted protein [Olea europaea subsp. europaea]
MDRTHLAKMARMNRIPSMLPGARTRMLLAKVARSAMERMASKLLGEMTRMLLAKMARMLEITLHRKIRMSWIIPFEVASKKKGMNNSNGNDQDERHMKAASNDKLTGKMDDLHTVTIKKDKERITPLLISK